MQWLLFLDLRILMTKFICSFASALKETMMLIVNQLIGTTANSYLLWQFTLFLHLCALSWVRIWPTLLLFFLPWHLTFSMSHLGLSFVWLLISDIGFFWLAISSENSSFKKKGFVTLLSLAIDMLLGLTILKRKLWSYSLSSLAARKMKSS